MQAQFPTGDGMGQGGEQRRHTRRRGQVGAANAIAAAPVDLQHGVEGLLQVAFGGAVRVIHRRADAARQKQFETIYQIRPAQHGRNRHAQAAGVVRAFGEHAGNAEVGRAQPLHHGRHGGEAGHPRLDLRAQPVGARRAEGVAGMLEAVEADDQHGQRMGRADLRAVLVQRGDERRRLDGAVAVHGGWRVVSARAHQ
ncbi:hypothetical protein D3C85_1275580 [compost metagenome]